MAINRSGRILFTAAICVLAGDLGASVKNESAAGGVAADAWYFDKYFQRHERFSYAQDEIIVKYRTQTTAEDAALVADRHGLAELHELHPGYRFAHYQLPADRDTWDAVADLQAEQSVLSACPLLIDQRGARKPVVGNEMTVRFTADLDEAACEAVIAEMGSQVVRDQWTPGYYTITVPAGKTLFESIRAFNAREDVKFAELSLIGFDDELYVPNDPFFDNQWNLDNLGQISGCGWCPPFDEHDVDAVAAWDLTMGIPSVIIVIIDTGCDMDHPDLAANYLPRGDEDWDFADDFDKVPDDSNGHGTGTAGIAAAVADNGKGVAGIAPGCRIMPLRIDLTSGQNQNRADAINYAASRRNEFDGMVLSNSWRMSAGSYTAVYDAIENAKALGCVVCFATGNENAPPVEAPSDSEHCIAVGGSSPCDERKSPSSCDGENYWGASYGSAIDVTAPAVKIVTTSIGGYTWSFNGTSSACPLAAGVCGLILSANPNLTPDEVQAALEAGCDDIESPGWDQYTGWGRVNAYNSVLLVMEDCPEDINGDGDVDTADLLFLLGAWGTPDGDVDGDGDTDTADLLALLGAWGECP